MIVVSRYSTWDPNQAPAAFMMAEMVAEAHFARTTLGASLDLKLYIIFEDPTFMIGVGYIFKKRAK